MKVSQILPISKFNMTRNNSLSHIPFVRQKEARDSVSFCSTKNILQLQFDELSNTIATEIIPFVEDSKNVYRDLTKTCFELQKSLNTFKEKEASLLQAKINALAEAKVNTTGDFEQIIETADNFEHNINQFVILSSHYDKSSPYYSKMNDLIEYNLDLFCTSEKTDKFINDAKNIKNEVNIINENKYKELDKVCLKNFDERVAWSYDSQNTSYLELMFYILKTPTLDAIKLLKNVQKIEKELNNPNKNSVTLLKIIENARQEASNIVQRKNEFQNDKQDIIKAINKANIVLANRISDKQVSNVYSNMEKVCDYLDLGYLGFSELVKKVDVDKEIYSYCKAMIPKQNLVLQKMKNIINSTGFNN